MKLKFWELSEEDKERVEKKWKRKFSLDDDYEQLVDSPIPFELFKEKYVGVMLPGSISYIYDLHCLLHLHKKEIEKLKRAIAEKSLVPEKGEVK